MNIFSADSFGNLRQNCAKLRQKFAEIFENMLSQESQKMFLECRVASNPSVDFQLDDFHFNCFNWVFNLIFN